MATVMNINVYQGRKEEVEKKSKKQFNRAKNKKNSSKGQERRTKKVA